MTLYLYPDAPRMLPPSSGSETFGGLQFAMTIQGQEVAESILQGRKDVNNTHERVPLGWIALHIGKSGTKKIVPESDTCLTSQFSLSQYYPKGAIVGICWVERAVTVSTLQTEHGCKDECDVTPKRWCCVISATIRIRTPVPCEGRTSHWRLKEETRNLILDQLVVIPSPTRIDVVHHGPELPQDRPFPKGGPSKRARDEEGHARDLGHVRETETATLVANTPHPTTPTGA